MSSNLKYGGSIPSFSVYLFWTMFLMLSNLFQPSFFSTFYADPLEQFEAFRLADVTLLRWITNVGLTTACVCVIWLYLTIFHSNILKDAYDFVMSITFGLVKSIVKENLPLERQQYFLPFYFLFGFIFFINLFGLVPFSFTPTSCICVTFFLSSMHYIGINFLAIWTSKWKVLNLFLPSGVPIAGAPFLIIIEFISYLARVFSLSIRLFANMMSGHALLKILSGFSWNLGKAGVIFLFIAIVPWSLVTLIMFLEILVAFLQAYVFTVLIAVYTHDVLVSH